MARKKVLTKSNGKNILFGEVEGDQVSILEFCDDPDGSGLPWIQSTGKVTKVGTRLKLRERKRRHRGQCFDTGEFYSHIGILLKSLIDRAPKNTTLVVVAWTSYAGTRTFVEEVSATYYR